MIYVLKKTTCRSFGGMFEFPCHFLFILKRSIPHKVSGSIKKQDAEISLFEKSIRSFQASMNCILSLRTYPCILHVQPELCFPPGERKIQALHLLHLEFILVFCIYTLMLLLHSDTCGWNNKPCIDSEPNIKDTLVCVHWFKKKKESEIKPQN